MIDTFVGAGMLVFLVVLFILNFIPVPDEIYVGIYNFNLSISLWYHTCIIWSLLIPVYIPRQFLTFHRMLIICDGNDINYATKKSESIFGCLKRTYILYTSINQYIEDNEW